MKKQITFHISIIILLIMTLFSSCLKKDLPNYPLWDGNYIDNVYVEYRWQDTTQTYNGQPVVAYQKLNVAQTIDSVNNTINITLTVPAANGSFTSAQRAKVRLSHLWIYFDISNSATIKGIGKTPAPGDSANLSQPLTYEVTAANGQKRTWTVNIAPLPIINKYEGSYTSNGYFYHPSSPRAITNLVKSVLSAGSNSVIVDLGDLGSSGYSALFTIDESTNDLTITAAPGAAGAPYTMFTSGLPVTNPGYSPQWGGSTSCNNTYDPATKTFYVRYGYMGSGGWRVTEEILKMN